MGLGRSEILWWHLKLELRTTCRALALNWLSLDLEPFPCSQDLRPDAAMYCHFLGGPCSARGCVCVCVCLCRCSAATLIGFTPRHPTKWRVLRLGIPSTTMVRSWMISGTSIWCEIWTCLFLASKSVLLSSWWFEVPPVVLCSFPTEITNKVWNMLLQVDIAFTWGVMATHQHIQEKLKLICPTLVLKVTLRSAFSLPRPWKACSKGGTAGGTPVRKPTLTLRRHHHCLPESCEVPPFYFAKSWWGRGKIWKDKAFNILNLLN